MDRNDTPPDETPPAAQAPGLFRFSTDDLPERDRVAFFREVVSRSMLKVDMESKDERFWCEANGCALPGLLFGAFANSATRAARTPELIAMDPADDLLLHVQRRGAIRVSQRGREATFSSAAGPIPDSSNS